MRFRTVTHCVGVNLARRDDHQLIVHASTDRLAGAELDMRTIRT